MQLVDELEQGVSRVAKAAESMLETPNLCAESSRKCSACNFDICGNSKLSSYAPDGYVLVDVQSHILLSSLLGFHSIRAYKRFSHQHGWRYRQLSSLWMASFPRSTTGSVLRLLVLVSHFAALVAAIRVPKSSGAPPNARRQVRGYRQNGRLSA